LAIVHTKTGAVLGKRSMKNLGGRQWKKGPYMISKMDES
jgi:hypothetical protein